MQTGSLYEISVASSLQAVTGVTVFLRKGLDHCVAKGIDPMSLVETRLFADMLPFHYQITCVAAYSVGAIDAARQGVFPPPSPKEGQDYAALITLMDETLKRLQSLREVDVNQITTQQVIFKLPQGDLPFALRDFFLSFVLPNLYFHATTAYDILRMKGVALGKLDFIGPMRIAAP